MATLSSIADSSTVAPSLDATSGNKGAYDSTTPIKRSTFQPLSRPRFTGDVMMDNAHVGPKDGKNTALALEKTIQEASSDKVGNRNKGELYASMNQAYLYDKNLRPSRPQSTSQHGPDSFVNDTDRAKMRHVVTLHDPGHAVNAMPSRNFEFGGSKTDNDPYSFIGANGSVPVMSSSELTRNPGLDHTRYSDYSDFSKFDKMAKENFMKRMSEKYLDFKKK